MQQLKLLIPILLSFAVSAHAVVSAEHMHIDEAKEAECDVCTVLLEVPPTPLVAPPNVEAFNLAFLDTQVSAALAASIRHYSRDPPALI